MQGQLQPDSDEEKTQSGRAYKAIRRKVLRCELAPSEIVNEKALMSELGFGRTPIREALLRLACERLVLFRRSQRIEIAPIDFTVLRDLYEDRLHSERLAARLCALRMDELLEANIVSCFDPAAELLEQGRYEDVINLDFAFHSMIYKGSKNSFLTHHLHELFGHSYRVWYLTNDIDPERLQQIAKSHRPLIEALVDRNLERLDTEIEAHIADAYNHVFEVLRKRTFVDQGKLGVRTLNELTGTET